MALTKITTSVVAVNSLTSANIADNSIDATKIANNQILARHIAADALSDQIADNAIGIAQLNVSDGSSGQALVTNGSGTLSFASVGITGISSSADATAITIDSNENISFGGGSNASNFSGYVTLDLRDTTGGIIDFSEASAGVHSRIQAVVNNSLNITNRQAYPLNFGTNDTTRMTIDASGALFLNTTSAMDNCFVSLMDHTNGEAFVGIEAKDDSNVGIRLGHGGTRKWVWYSDPSDNLIYYSNAGSAERMRIDSSGRVGIGTDNPSNYYSGADNLVVYQSSGEAGITVATATNTTGALYFADGTSGNEQYRGGIAYSHGAEILSLVSGGATKAIINSSGHLLVGTTSDAALDGVSPGICVGSTSSTTSGITFSNANHEWLIYNASDGKLRFYDSTDNTEFAFVDTGRRFTFGGNYAHATYDHAAVFGKNSTPLGTVVIEDFDVSSGIGNTVLNLYLRDQDPATNAKFVVFRDGGGSVGSIIHNDDGGGVTYNTTSDYRLKENVDYDWDGTTLLKQLKPCKFNFKRAPGRTVQGMLAHEVMNIVPHSVTGDKDHMMEVGTIKDSDDNILYEGVYEHFAKADQGHTWTKTGTEPYYQELDYSRLVPLLVKTIQELEARIATLEG